MTTQNPKASAFFANLADTQVSFQQNEQIAVAGVIYNVSFEKHLTALKPTVRALAQLDGEIVAKTPWQATPYPELSSLWSLRHALETINRPLFKPNAGDIARFTIEGREIKGLITGNSRHIDGLLVAETDKPPFLEGSNLLLTDAIIRSYETERFIKTSFFEEVNVWKRAAGQESPHRRIAYSVNKPLWVIS